MFKVMGQGQRSRGSRSKVKWVKPGLKVMILAGGLTPTSSCIFNICFGPAGCRAHSRESEAEQQEWYPFRSSHRVTSDWWQYGNWDETVWSRVFGTQCPAASSHPMGNGGSQVKGGQKLYFNIGYLLYMRPKTEVNCQIYFPFYGVIHYPPKVTCWNIVFFMRVGFFYMNLDFGILPYTI